MSTFFPVKLPSACRLYKNVDPQGVSIRPFTGGDEEKLASCAPKHYERVLNEVLQDCVKGVKVQELTIGDRLFLMVWQAHNSYVDETSCSLTCEFCSQKIVNTYKLSSLKVVPLSEKFSEPFVVSLSLKQEVKVRLLRALDKEILAPLEADGVNTYLYTYALSIIDDRADLEKKVEFLRNLPKAGDLAKIRAVQENFYHGLDFNIPYKCGKCGGEGKVFSPFRFDQFIPFGQSLAQFARTEI